MIKLRRAESTRRARKRRAKARSQFVKNPFQFTKKLLGQERSGSLERQKTEVEEYLKDTHSDPDREEDLGHCPKIIPLEEPGLSFNCKEPSWKEVKEVVRKARGKSAPGPSGIPYKVYKNCPSLLKLLWQMLRAVWKKGKIPKLWKRAEGCLVPKEKNSSEINQFRTISLLSVEGKIFFSILSRRTTGFLLGNNYIDPSAQKGGIPGFSGCVEHTSAISQLIHEAKSGKGNLTAVWLDLANAYGSIPHRLLEYAMDHHHIPPMIRELVKDYFNGIQLRFSTPNYTTEWQNLEKGIVTGCTISPILFVMGMNLVIRAGLNETRGPITNSGIRLPPVRGYMDDLTITTTSHIQARWILKTLEEVVSWARMKFKPQKSRFMIVKAGKLSTRNKLRIQGEEIPSVVGNPIKCLGKWYDETLKDKNSIDDMRSQMKDWMKKTDKSELPGKYKAWIYQHGILPRLSWLLTIYEVPISTVEELERAANSCLRRWLGVPPSMTSMAFYSRSAKLQLPLSSIVEEFKVSKCRLVMTLRESDDKKISEAGIQTRTGRKWSPANEVWKAEEWLKLKDIIGNMCEGRQGLGFSHFNQWKEARGKERRDLIQDEIRRTEENTRLARAVQMGQQGRWTRWTVEQKKVSWAEIWRMEPVRISFMLRSVYDLLPSPTNLCRWGLTEDSGCKLCGMRGTLRHILTACKPALTQGRYRWRHDKVLLELADILEIERKKKRSPSKQKNYIRFVKPGEKIPTEKFERRSILERSQSWDMKVDLGRKLVFPDIVHTTLRPDIVIWSASARTIIIIELTVPWEENCEDANERKTSKYTELSEMCRQRGWKTHLYPVEVGCRGFPAKSIMKLFKSLGVVGRQRQTAIKRLSEAAEKASCWLWSRRDDQSWKPNTDTQ